MSGEPATSREAGSLFLLATAVSMIGIFSGIFFLFISTDVGVRIAAALLVGIVGILSFVRHSVYFRSDQIRMGWVQEHPEFQLEVGYANLAIGIWALIIAVFYPGPAACGLVLAVYATYLLCTLFLHWCTAFSRNVRISEMERERAKRSTFLTLFFVLVLFAFALIGFAHAGLVPFMSL